jgi:glycosyltransferase involved in cell wall biosynthesis
MQKATRKYLDRHAEPEAKAIGESVVSESPFSHVLILPVFAEGENLFETLESIPPSSQGPVLVILVLNGSPHSTPKELEQNQMTLLELKKRFPQRICLSPLPPISLHEFPKGNLLIIDRSSSPYLFPEKEGVGLARKIGCDLALGLWARGLIRSPWIHTTDADVIVSPDYFEKAEKIVDDKVSTLLYPFTHVVSPDPVLAEAMRLYEIHLRYYVAGLQWAGSPYAFHTIGSTLAFRAASYAEAGGFPARMAAEDFYLLNKLAKLGKVHRLAGPPLQILGRLSERVPFGTGKALGKIVSEQKQNHSFDLYDPTLFSHLKFWLLFLEKVSEKYTENTSNVWRESVRQAPLSLSFEPLKKILEKMEAFEAIEEAKTRSSHSSILLRHLLTWFDGFRTLKLLHALRDQAFPSLPWKEALSKADFIGLKSWEGGAEPIRLHLMNQERVLS